jgi:hypothetical protein
MRKVFVDVIVKHTKDGRRLPMIILWENGKKYEVEKVLDIRRAASLKAGGQGLKYKCRILGSETCLWLEDGKWFVEAK